MPHFQIEMLWRCICPPKQINKGLSRHCSYCGRPKGPEMEEFFPDDISIRNALHGEDQRKALAGEDYDCKYCGQLNSALNQCCTGCGADKATGAKPWKTTDQTATLDVETGVKTVGPTHEVAIGLEIATVEQRIDFEVTQAAAPASPSYDDVPPTGGYSQWKRKQQPRSWWPLFLALGAVLLCVGGWLLFRTKEVRARVTSTHWDHQVFIDKYQVFRREGFDTDPDGFNVRDEGQRQHHINFHVLVGHHWDRTANPYDCHCVTHKGRCHTTKVVCTKSKNGTADCNGGDQVCAPDTQTCDTCYHGGDVNDYADIPVMREYYSWDAWGWKYDRTVTHSCDEPASVCGKPNWPVDQELLPPASLLDGQRERNHREEHYSLVLSEPDDTPHDYTPKSETEFLSHPMKSTMRIRVGIARSTEILP